MNVSILVGRGASGDHGPIDFWLLYENRALNGSESTAINMARALSSRGHAVTIIAPDALTEGVTPERLIVRKTGWGASPNVCVVVSDPGALSTAPSTAFRVNLHQLGDMVDGAAHNAYVDAHVFVSPGQLQHVLATTPGLDATKVLWIPNSINPEFFAPQPLEARARRMAWISSPDRGLHRLLEMWPDIRSRVSDVELAIYYRIDPFLQQWKDRSGPFGDRARYILSAFEAFGRNGENGITVHGPTGNRQLATDLCRTRVLPYTFDPLSFTETFCVAIVDAAAAGCVPLCSDLDVLAENFGEMATVIPGRPGDSRDAWVNAICTALADDAWAREAQKRAATHVPTFNRDAVGMYWERFFSNNIGTKTLHRNGMPLAWQDLFAVTADSTPVVPSLVPTRTGTRAPKVSVLVPAYRPGGLDITFAALRDQTFKDFEVIVVDRRYEKRHAQVMQAAAQYGLNVIHAPEHRRNGKWIVAATAYNTAAALAAGEYIIFLHEWWWAPPHWIQSHVDLLQTNDRAISVTPYTAGEPPELKTVRPFDFKAPRELVWENPNGAILVPDPLLAEDIIADEVFAFTRGPFASSWIPDLATIATVDYRPDDRWHTDARRSMWANGQRPTHTWSVMCNDGVSRELFLALGGLDEMCDKSKGIFDADFSSRVVKVGGEVLFAPDCLCVSVRPQKVVRSMPCGARNMRVGSRWSDVDGIAYYEKQLASPRKIVRNPININDVARKLLFWRVSGAERVSLDVPDSMYWGRDPLWPEDLSEDFFRD